MHRLDSWSVRVVLGRAETVEVDHLGIVVNVQAINHELVRGFEITHDTAASFPQRAHPCRFTTLGGGHQKAPRDC